MNSRSVILWSALGATLCTGAAHATFTGFSVQRGQANPNGNIVWEIRANFNTTGLSSGQQWVFLNAYNWTTVSGSLSALHSDSGASWNASYTNAGNANTDSFVTATGTYGAGTALDPNFDPSTGSSIPPLAGWYDATPWENNIVDNNTMSYLVAQIVRTPTASLYIGSLELTYKATGTAVGIFGAGSFVIPGIPAPGAVVLAGLAGLTGRRRR
ncbi:MAG: hypothetical protein FJ270_08395 [Planctomycetes bacterium]|nr:hypothetical protein [Planctomycetota bacterium]